MLPDGAPVALAEALRAVARRTEQLRAGELALVMDKLDDASAVIEAVPAIDVDGDVGAGVFSPFGRGDTRVRNLTQADERLLAGEPQPLRILVPVLIEA